MKDVIQKIETIYDELVARNDLVVGRITELNKKEEMLNDMAARLDSASNDVNARRRIIEKYEDFEDEKKRWEAEKLLVQQQHEDNKKQADALDKLELSLEKKQGELDKMVGAYSVKAKRLAKAEEDLKIEKENLREVILEEIRQKI
jgi:peptidoglycan hydrolase CwlO-like protein